MALRRDNHRFITADTLAELEEAVEADYRDHPVPRDFDPAGTSDYLAQQNGPMVPDGETVLLLAQLRQAFPLWVIDYSPLMRVWVARTRKKLICENSAGLLCMALMLIERQQQRSKNRPARQWPPGGDIPPA